MQKYGWVARVMLCLAIWLACYRPVSATTQLKPPPPPTPTPEIPASPAEPTPTEASIPSPPVPTPIGPIPTATAETVGTTLPPTPTPTATWIPPTATATPSSAPALPNGNATPWPMLSETGISQITVTTESRPLTMAPTPSSTPGPVAIAVRDTFAQLPLPPWIIALSLVILILIICGLLRWSYQRWQHHQGFKFNRRRTLHV